MRRKLLQGEPEPPAAGAAAVALILREERRNLEVLLIERMERVGDPWSGQIALPGGRVDPRDRTLSDTARREALEEVSVEVEDVCLSLGRLPEVSPVNVPELVVFPFVYSLQKETEVRPGAEVKEAFWASLRSIKESRTTREVEIRGRRLTVPAFIHGERVIWGLTYRILASFFELGPEELGGGSRIV